jgi:hypothetical protein
MAQFISLDDGLSYVNADQIESFKAERVENGGRYTVLTVFTLKNGLKHTTSRPITEVAEMLKAVNVWY